MTPTQKELLAEVERRVADSIMEPGTAELMRKLIVQADNDDEAIKVMQLGTTYKRTGLHFDHRLERSTSDIHYLRRNEALSFHTDDSKPVHRLIIGDNYPALQNLLVQYRSKVGVIYIDPPYGKDSMGEFAKTNYENALTRDNLLSMLWPRLQLAKMLLSDSGVIFCSIDDRNQAYVKCLFDEVFGESNFIATMIWEQGKKHIGTFIGINHEYVLVFAKNKEAINDNSNKWRQRKNGLDKIYSTYENLKRKHKSDIDKIELGMKDFFNSLPENDGAYGSRHYSKVDSRGLFFADNISQGTGNGPRYDVIHPKTGKPVAKPAGGWRYSYETMQQLLDEDRIYFGEDETTVPCRKRYLAETEYELPCSVFYRDGRGATNELESILGKNVFDNPKDWREIARMINFRNNAIILDFFAGSGTTGHAVLELNRQEAEAGNLLKERKPEGRRQFILVQLDEKTDTTPGGIACDVTAERLRRIMTGKASDGSSDFDWLKKHRPYGGNLEVLELATVADFEHTEGKTPADVIDETLYGLTPFTHLRDKMDWLCANFPQTQKTLD